VVNAGCVEKDLAHIGSHLDTFKVRRRPFTDAFDANRTIRVSHGGDREWPLNEARRPHIRSYLHKHSLAFEGLGGLVEMCELEPADAACRRVAGGRGRLLVGDPRRPVAAGAAGPQRRAHRAEADVGGPVEDVLLQLCELRHRGHPLLGHPHRLHGRGRLRDLGAWLPHSAAPPEVVGSAGVPTRGDPRHGTTVLWEATSSTLSLGALHDVRGSVSGEENPSIAKRRIDSTQYGVGHGRETLWSSLLAPEGGETQVSLLRCSGAGADE
jgi:hypothetical protein